jgi:minichromosome maintenance protein 10
MRREREVHEPQSPLKRSSTTPNFHARALLQDGNDNGQVEGEDEEEDEETLRLQLAAIEAKLKLKKLQQSKSARPATASSDGEDVRQRRPSSPTRPQSRLNAMRERLAASDRGTDVQVPLSPSKKAAIPEPASPRRALFNFKKASEVSLKRPSSSRAGGRPTSSFSSGTRTSSAASKNDHDSSDIWSPPLEDLKRAKSFSERIAESRNSDKAKQERAKRIQENRSSGFAVDKAEVERYKEEAASNPQSTSPVKKQVAQSFSREDVLQSYGGAYPSMKKSVTAPVIRETPSTASPQLSGSRSKTTAHSRDNSSNTPEADQSKLEPFSSLNLSNRILPHSFLTRTLENKTVLRIPHLLKSIKAPEFELPESVDGDYVVFGIVASKSDPKQHKEKKASTKEVDMHDDGLNNSEQYMVITLTDLQWTVDLFLFDTAFPRYYRLSEGMVIAILNPTIMPPPPNKIDSGRFSLCLSSSDDTVLEVGSARDIGYCKAERKDGKVCRSWLDARKTEFCDFHVDVQVRRTQSQRPGVNAGTGMFAPGGRNAPRIANFAPSRGGGRGGGRGNGPRGLKQEGAKYDWGTQSTYFVAPAPKSSSARGGGASMYHRGGMGGAGSSAATLIDTIDDNPFAANNVRGNESKEERTRRRLLEDQRERDIAKKLGSRSGNTGSEYLRARLGQTKPSSSPASSAELKDDAAAMPFLSRKADSVSLGPIRKRAHEDEKSSKGSGASVKKTRFITSKGIREAGRDSICGHEARRTIMNNNDDDDDDELDII